MNEPEPFSPRLEVISAGATLTLDAIDFENAAFIKFETGSQLDVFMLENDAVIVGDELVKSLQGSGRFLIFTNPSGIADDGGWTGVDVQFKDSTVRWSLDVDEHRYLFCFDESRYRSAIEKLRGEIWQLPAEIVFEPSQVNFPEDW